MTSAFACRASRSRTKVLVRALIWFPRGELRTNHTSRPGLSCSHGHRGAPNHVRRSIDGHGVALGSLLTWGGMESFSDCPADVAGVVHAHRAKLSVAPHSRSGQPSASRRRLSRPRTRTPPRRVSTSPAARSLRRALTVASRDAPPDCPSSVWVRWSQSGDRCCRRLGGAEWRPAEWCAVGPGEGRGVDE
jgi:hypothetical protein